MERRGGGLLWLSVGLAVVPACAERPQSAEAPVLYGERSEDAPRSAELLVARRPDAVVIERPTAVPEPTQRATADGVVALRQPLGADAVRDVVREVVEAWQRETVDPLVALLTEDSGPIEARSRGRTALVEAWRQRMRAHEYHRLAGVELVRPDRIETYTWDDLSAPSALARPPDMRQDELYVRAPFEVTRFAGERLFGDWLLLLLRREDGKYRIAAYGESE